MKKVKLISKQKSFLRKVVYNHEHNHVLKYRSVITSHPIYIKVQVLTIGAPRQIQHAVAEQVVHDDKRSLERRQPDTERAVPGPHRRAATLLAFLHEYVTVETLGKTV